MNDLLPLAETIAARLKARKETIAVAESSTGGLISAALLAVGGASAYFMGGGVVYTRQAKQLLLSIDDAAIARFRAATEGHARGNRGARAHTRARRASAFQYHLGPVGNRRYRADRQPLRRSGRAHVHRPRRREREGNHAANRQGRPRRQHVRVRRRGAQAARGQSRLRDLREWYGAGVN